MLYIAFKTKHFSIECEYNNCDIYDVFNVIQYQILLIDIKDEKQYNHSHIRQAYHINKVIQISSNEKQDSFVSKDTSLPIHIYDQSMFHEKKNENNYIASIVSIIDCKWISEMKIIFK